MRSLSAWIVLLAAGCSPWDFAEGRRKLEALEPHLESRDRWEVRAARVRAGILHGAGLSVLPERTPLNPFVNGRRERGGYSAGKPGYSIENVALEVSPGFYLAGNLYRPLARGVGVPGILAPHGHFAPEQWFARSRPEMQALCSHLAQMGAVVFAYDMVGWGETLQKPHSTPDVLALQLWDSMRALDFLESLPEVDPSRLAIVGASGGASQAIFLAAVDERVAVSVPIIMVSAAYDGGDECETGMPIREEARTNNVEIAAVFAPRPQLLVSDGSDWTADTPGSTFPFLQKVYRLYGAEGDVGNVHLLYEGHDFGDGKRRAVYPFLAHQLALDELPVEERFQMETPESQRVFAP